MPDALNVAYRAAVRSVVDPIKMQAVNNWRNLMLNGLNQLAMQVFADATGPAAVAAQMAVSNITSAFLGQRTGKRPIAPVPSNVLSRNGTPDTTSDAVKLWAEQYARPFIQARSLVKNDGMSLEDAVDRTAIRIATMIDTDNQMSKLRQAHASLRHYGKTRYKRVNHPEEAKSGHSCGLCILASTRVYYIEDLMPIHNGCNCDVDVLQPGDITVVDGKEYVGLSTLKIPEELMYVGPRADPNSTRSIQAYYLQQMDKRQFEVITEAWAKTVVVSEHSEIGPVMAMAPSPSGPNPVELFNLPDSGGRWAYVKSLTEEHGTQTEHRWEVAPATYPTKVSFTNDFGRTQTVYYDPALTTVTKGEFKPVISTPENTVSDLKPPEGLIWRGMSSEEYKAAEERGYFESLGSYNVGGESQAGKTYFSTDPDQAAHYASWFAPQEYKPTFDHPAYVVGIPDPGLPREQGTEVGVPGRIPFDSIQKTYVGQVYAVKPGDFGAYEGGYQPWERAGSMQPSPMVKWIEPPDPDVNPSAASYEYWARQRGLNPFDLANAETYVSQYGEASDAKPIYDWLKPNLAQEPLPIKGTLDEYYAPISTGLPEGRTYDIYGHDLRAAEEQPHGLLAPRITSDMSLKDAVANFKEHWPEVDISGFERPRFRRFDTDAGPAADPSYFHRWTPTPEQERVMVNWLRGADDTFMMFPSAAEQLNFLSIGEPNGSSSAFAETTPGISKVLPAKDAKAAYEVTFNERYLRYPQYYAKTMADSIADGHFYPLGDESAAYITSVHEMGHVVDMAAGFEAAYNPRSVAQAMEDAYTAVTGELVPFDPFDPDIEAYAAWSVENMSGYSGVNSMEMVAESFADVMIRGDEASPVSKGVFNWLLTQSQDAGVITPARAEQLMMEMTP